MIHVLMASGGAGSEATGERICMRYGAANVVSLFTDTLVEDGDLYRFLIECAAYRYGVPRPDELLARCADIPDIKTEDDVVLRKIMLAEISAEAMRLIPNLVWIADGRTPWEVFYDKRYLGNSRIAQCSHVLKQEMARKWIEANYAAGECTLYLGIDWSEDHRRTAPTKNWLPYTVEFPMCDEPYEDRNSMLAVPESRGIKRPRLYLMGFAHNNCAGACVRAGHGHWANLFDKMPESYAYQERKEADMREYLGKDVTILKLGAIIDGRHCHFDYRNYAIGLKRNRRSIAMISEAAVVSYRTMKKRRWSPMSWDDYVAGWNVGYWNGRVDALDGADYRVKSTDCQLELTTVDDALAVIDPT
jgi:hypothetical protein